jgi:isoquinoline 1-oxidoreductase beta subunit
VLDRLVDRARWGTLGTARGLAIHETFGTVVGRVAEVSVERGALRVHRVTCVVDCGLAVNPSGVIAQMQSGIVYGLSAGLFGRITLKDGRVQESNWMPVSSLRRSSRRDRGRTLRQQR